MKIVGLSSLSCFSGPRMVDGCAFLHTSSNSVVFRISARTARVGNAVRRGVIERRVESVFRRRDSFIFEYLSLPATFARSTLTEMFLGSEEARSHGLFNK